MENHPVSPARCADTAPGPWSSRSRRASRVWSEPGRCAHLTRQRRGGRGVIGATTRESDFTENLAVCSTHDTLLFLSDRGRVYWQRVYELPLMGRTATGRP